MSPPIHFEIDQNQVGFITLNRPLKRNALNWAAMEAIAAILQEISSRDDLCALILVGEGDAFCAGGDLFELHNYASRADGERLANLMADALAMLAKLPIPVIAAMEGPAVGGGAEIALACDLRVMAQSAQIGFPQIRLGIIPTWGGLGRLLELVGYARAFAWLSTGGMLDSQEAFGSGLIYRVVPDGQALSAARTLAQEYSAWDRATLHALKSMLHAHLSLPTQEATALERSVFADLWTAQAHREASSKFINRRRTP